MRHLLWLAAIVVVLAAMALWLLRGPRPDGASTGTLEPASRAERDDRAPAAAAPPAAELDVERAPTQEASPPPAAEPASEASGRERWLVTVRVAEPDAPVAGASVTLALERGRLVTPIGAGTSDASGEVELDASAELASLSRVARSLARFVATARASGFRTGIGSLELAGLAPGSRELLIVMERGAMLRGRVVDSAARGVSGARAVLVQDRERDQATSDEAGAFELPIERAGVHRLFVAALGLGNTVKRLELDPDGDHDVGTLELRGAGSLAGRVIDPLGFALADVEVHAFLPGKDGQGPWYDEFDGEGMLRSQARTDSDGRFVLRGLAVPGPYTLAVPEAASCTEPGGTRLHETGEDEIELVVEIHRLLVRVVDESGSPLPGASLLVRCGGRARTATVTRVDGSFELIGRAGETWTVGASAPGCLPAELAHEFVPDRSRDERTLVLQRAGAARGSLRLVWPAAPALPCDAASVDVRTPLGGIVERAYRVDVGPDGLLERLVPGSFRVTVRPGRTEVPGMPEFTWFFPETRDVVIEPETETRLVLEGRCGGRLRLVIRLPEGISNDTLHSLRVERLGSDGAKSSLGPFVRRIAGPQAGHELGALAADVPLVSAHLLEPGPHTLRIEGDGLVPLERSFTVRAGAYADVEVAVARE